MKILQFLLSVSFLHSVLGNHHNETSPFPNGTIINIGIFSLKLSDLQKLLPSLLAGLKLSEALNGTINESKSSPNPNILPLSMQITSGSFPAIYTEIGTDDPQQKEPLYTTGSPEQPQLNNLDGETTENPGRSGISGYFYPENNRRSFPAYGNNFRNNPYSPSPFSSNFGNYRNYYPGFRPSRPSPFTPDYFSPPYYGQKQPDFQQQQQPDFQQQQQPDFQQQQPDFQQQQPDFQNQYSDPISLINAAAQTLINSIIPAPSRQNKPGRKQNPQTPQISPAIINKPIHLNLTLAGGSGQKH